jgi:hypothetical protein
MLTAGRGLTAVSTDDLKAVLRAVHRGELPCPIVAQGLAMTGLLRLLDDLEPLRGLDEAGVRAVLTCTLAERSPR